MKIKSVLKDVAKRTGEPLSRISAQYVPFNPRPFQGGVLVKIRRKLVSFNVRMDDAMLGVDVEQLSPDARTFWKRFRANQPSMRLIDKDYGTGPSKEVNKLQSTVSTWSFSTDMGGILSGAFVPFSAYDRFKTVADPTLTAFGNQVDYVAKSVTWWFEQSEKYHRGWLGDVLVKMGREADIDTYIKVLRDQLPDPATIRETCSLDYGITYIVGDQPVLAEEVVDTVRRIVGATDLNRTTFHAGEGPAADIWATAMQYPLTPDARRLILVRDAETLTRWSPLEHWLANTRTLPSVYLLFVSNTADVPGRKETWPAHLALLRARARHAQIVRCVQPNPEDAIAWVRVPDAPGPASTSDALDALVRERDREASR